MTNISTNTDLYWASEESDLCIRTAQPNDCEMLFHWRNDSVSVAMSLQSGELRWDAHYSWYQHALSDSKHIILICAKLSNGDPLAVVRFNIRGHDATVSLMVNPEERGKGYSKKCLSMSICAFMERHALVDRFIADIKKINLISESVFQSVGFHRFKIEEHHCTFVLLPVDVRGN